ncbi:MAG: alpha/beta hydrolase [unclassified Hahellaceae]|nr:alpha/beta hydrolase [Hahellaceae bacterium]|tara:strand:- start:29355 stop:30152 length:798 start_codon:yes stop_codon:yes gene_type:complete
MAKTSILPPGRLLQIRECTMGLDLMHYVAASASPFSDRFIGRRAYNAFRRPVNKRTALLVPGFGGGPRSLFALKQTAEDAGYQAFDWGLGTNNGDVRHFLPLVQQRLVELAERSGEPVTLIGWSLGGYISREVARDLPQHVRQVITLGTPVVGGPRYTIVAKFYERQGHDLEKTEAEIKARYDDPIQVPVKAIYSKRDGVVSWEACIDHWTPDIEHIEVRQAHLGLGFSPSVNRIVSRLLTAADKLSEVSEPKNSSAMSNVVSGG